MVTAAVSNRLNPSIGPNSLFDSAMILLDERCLNTCKSVPAPMRGGLPVQINLLMAQILVLNDTSVLYHLHHVTLGAGVASNLTETVH